MTRKPDLQSPESVLAKVRNQARPGQTPHIAQVIFILERFLARVARSAHRHQFVLKGGILLYLTGKGPSTRPTTDIDMLAQSFPSGLLDQALAEHPHLSRLPVEGGWSVLLRRPAVDSGEDCALRLLREAQVLVHPGHFFDLPGDGYLVLSLLPAPEAFREGIRRVTAGLALPG